MRLISAEAEEIRNIIEICKKDVTNKWTEQWGFWDLPLWWYQPTSEPCDGLNGCEDKAVVEAYWSKIVCAWAVMVKNIVGDRLLDLWFVRMQWYGGSVE